MLQTLLMLVLGALADGKITFDEAVEILEATLRSIKAK